MIWMQKHSANCTVQKLYTKFSAYLGAYLGYLINLEEKQPTPELNACMLSNYFAW